MKPLLQHEDAKLFPRMTAQNYQELKEDIKLRGLLNPIVMYEGKILDGWHRYSACTQLGITPKFTEFTNTVISSLDYVISQNLKRRHLTTGQRASLAIVIEKRLIKEKRNFAHGRNGHTPKHLLTGIQKNNWSGEVAGKLLNVSHGSISYAKLVAKRRPDLMEKVKNGDMNLGKAYAMVKNPPQSISRSSAIDRIARKVLNECDFTDYKPPETVHCSRYEIERFDRYMAYLGFSLCINRVGDMYEAVYTKTNEKLPNGYLSFNAAILDAGKKALVSVKA